MTNPIFTDNRGKTVTIEIGATYAKAYGGTIKIEGWGERDCGADDDRTGMAVVDGITKDEDGEEYPGWAYLDDLQYHIFKFDSQK